MDKTCQPSVMMKKFLHSVSEVFWSQQIGDFKTASFFFKEPTHTKAGKKWSENHHIVELDA